MHVIKRFVHFGVVFSLLEMTTLPALGLSHFQLQNGDILFQDLDCGAICDAIETVTSGIYGARFSHVGVVILDKEGRPNVLEAYTEGVALTPLETFLQRNRDENGRPKVVVGRLKKPYRHRIPMALKRGLALLGKPYDSLFDIANDAYYCAELLYFMFLEPKEKKPFFTLKPMSFKQPGTDETADAWKAYFFELKSPVPEGALGINPGAISLSPFIEVIHEFGTPDGWKKETPNP
jgi:hypothetical protein